MNLSAENIGKIRELVRSGYLLKACDAKDLQGHNDHLIELLEARGRLMLGVEIERDQLKAENARSTEREILQLAEIEALRKALKPLLAHWADLKAGESLNVDAARAAMGKGEQS